MLGLFIHCPKNWTVVADTVGWGVAPDSKEPEFESIYLNLIVYGKSKKRGRERGVFKNA